jgi:hypothetical protein
MYTFISFPCSKLLNDTSFCLTKVSPHGLQGRLYPYLSPLSTKSRPLLTLCVQFREPGMFFSHLLEPRSNFTLFDHSHRSINLTDLPQHPTGSTAWKLTCGRCSLVLCDWPNNVYVSFPTSQPECVWIFLGSKKSACLSHPLGLLRNFHIGIILTSRTCILNLCSLTLAISWSSPFFHHRICSFSWRMKPHFSKTTSWKRQPKSLLSEP